METLSSNNIIAQNLNEINNRITVAANKCGRSPGEVLLVAVTKTVESNEIQVLFDCEIRNFGENRVQSLIEKMNYFSGKCNVINWHMIGSLQKNKIKYIIGKVKLIHSVDSYELLEEIDRHAKKMGFVQDVLFEINIANELTKHGLESNKILSVISDAEKLFNVKVKGLMCMAPFLQDKEDTRKYFCEMRLLNEKLKEKQFENFSGEFLSMGMTNDFEIAIEEGANIVRIGTAIFRGLK